MTCTPLYRAAGAALVLLAFSPLWRGPPESHGGEKPDGAARFVKELPPDRAAFFKQLEADERRITVRQANLFHYRFIHTCMTRLPPNLTVQQGGLLATFNAAKGIWLADSIGDPLSWTVFKDLGVFEFWITTAKTKFTLAKCTLEGTDIYVNVIDACGKRTVDEKLPELGGKSVREVFSEIDKAPPTTEETLRDIEKELGKPLQEYKGEAPAEK
jgi:hypothetical protein